METDHKAQAAHHRHPVERSLLVLDALSELTRQFANKPEFQHLINTLLLTFSGLFSVSSAFAMLRNPRSIHDKPLYVATGKFEHSLYLQTLILTPDLGRHFLANKSAATVLQLDLPGSCSSHGAILNDSGVKLICPFVHNDNLLGLIGLGESVTGRPFTADDIQLFDTLVSSVTPLVTSSYHFCEITSLSAWHLDILNNVKQGVFVFDIQNRFRKVNTVGYRILETFVRDVADPISLQGMPIEEVFAESAFPDWAPRFLKASIENQGGIIEDLVAQNTDIERIYDGYVTGISGESEFQTDLIITLDDVTYRKRAEKQRQQLQEELERAQRMESLGMLAGGVAHDLNNMLGPVVGYSELILLGLPEDSKIRKQVERIGKSALAAADVVQDLLSLARRGRYETKPTSLNELIVEYLDSTGYIKKCEENPEVTVELRLDDGLSRILGSASHLSQVVMNLTTNAFDAMPNGGQLTIETSQVYLHELFSKYGRIEAGEYAVLRVRDTGIGIASKDIERIFEPYYSKKKMGASGSGLGLSVVYGIVKDHKGYCDVVSDVGKGTEFVVYLPISRQTMALAQTCERDFGGTETVLVVDDVGGQRAVATELLTSLGYQVHSVENGGAAVAYLAEHEVDIVILDMIMDKGFDGLDTYREILKLRPGQKAVIVSGFSATDRVEKMQELGAGQFLKKPFTRDTIGRAVRRELDGEPARADA